MKKAFETPEIQVMPLEYVDVILASGTGSSPTDEVYTPWQDIRTY